MRLGVLWLVTLLVGCVGSPAAPDPASDSEPDVVLGAIGNSLMLGYNADWDHVESAPEVSWATGDEPWSFRARIGADHAENVAKPGAGSDEYLDQIAALDRATLVLVMLFDSAICGPPSDASAGQTSAFESELREGTRALVGRGMRPLLVSTPDIVSVAEAARAKPPVNDFILNYAFGQECAAEPGMAERQAAMHEVIVRVAEEEGALHDHGAVAQLRWTPEMVSDVDGFHPSLAGLEAIATAVWDAYEASES